MSSIAQSLIQAVEANGGDISVEGDWLVIHPRKAGQRIADALRLHKAEIIELLRTSTPKQDMPPMPAGVRLIRWEPKEPPVELSRYETVTDTSGFMTTTLKQLDAHLHGKTWLAGNWGLSVLIARLEAVGCYVALDNAKTALQ
jgi:hypothetical protein